MYSISVVEGFRSIVMMLRDRLLLDRKCKLIYESHYFNLIYIIYEIFKKLFEKCKTF